MNDKSCNASPRTVAPELPPPSLLSQHTRFQFHSRAEIANVPLSLTFMHHHGPGVTSIEASAFPPGRRLKVTAKQIMGTKGPLVKLEQGFRKLTGKLQFDFGPGRRDALGFGLKVVERGDYVEATYEHAKRRAEVVLCKNAADGGPLKVRHGGAVCC